MRKECKHYFDWNGVSFKCKDCSELKHPQDLVRGLESELEINKRFIREKLNIEEKLTQCKAAFNAIYDNHGDTEMIIDICDYHVNNVLKEI